MQEQEERVLDEHAKLVEEMEKWTKQHRRLLKMTETVDYDTEQYAREFRSLLEAMTSKTSKVQGKEKGRNGIVVGKVPEPGEGCPDAQRSTFSAQRSSFSYQIAFLMTKGRFLCQKHLFMALPQTRQASPKTFREVPQI